MCVPVRLDDMSFWRKEVIDFALDQETLLHIEEQKDWIAREPSNPQPYYQLALLYRMQRKPEEALALLLEAIHLDPSHARAQVALTELYTVREDYQAAWRHARLAERAGEAAGVDLLARHNILEES